MFAKSLVLLFIFFLLKVHAFLEDKLARQQELAESVSERGLDKYVKDLPDINLPFNSTYAFLFEKRKHAKGLLNDGVAAPDDYSTAATPAAQLYLPLTQSSDGTFYYVSLTFNPNEDSNTSMERNQRISHLIVDTGIGNVIAFSRPYCVRIHSPAPMCLQSSPDTSPYSTTYAIYFDLQRVYCELCYFIDLAVSTTAFVPNSGAGVSSAGTNAPAPVSSTLRSPIVYWWNGTLADGAAIPQYLDFAQAAGFAGFGYHTRHPSYTQLTMPAMLQQLLDASTTSLPTFGLDFSLPDEPASGMYLGGAPEAYRASVRWPLQSLGLSEHVFTALGVTVCGHAIVEQLLVLVDTATPCLSLPAVVFDFVMSWLPLRCEPTSVPPTNTMCFYEPVATETPRLPTLDFRLSVDGEWLHMPLERLLLPLSKSANTPYPTLQRMCVIRDTVRTYAIMGNLPLSAFYAQLDMPARKVGLANKVAASARTAQCLPRTQCRGMETSYEGFNGCIQPNCGDYYLLQYDPATSSCVAGATFEGVVGGLIAFFLLVDVVFFALELGMDRQVERYVPLLSMNAGFRQLFRQQQQQPAGVPSPLNLE